MEHCKTAAMLRAMFDQEGWFSLVRGGIHSTVLHLRTDAEPVCVLVSDGPTISVLVGAPSPDNEIITHYDTDSALSYLKDMDTGERTGRT